MGEQIVQSLLLEQALGNLSPKERELIEEIYFLEKTERQVSEALHMAKTTSFPFQTVCSVKQDDIKGTSGNSEGLWLAYGSAGTAMSRRLLSVSWRLYFIMRIAGCVAFFFPALAVIGIINVVNGNEKELPVIGKIRLM